MAPSEVLMAGAESYTSLAEVTEVTAPAVPEATVVTVTSALNSFVMSFNTVWDGC